MGTKANKLTVCIECAHFINKEPDSVRSEVWYNHLCKASPLGTAVDPYDGKRKPVLKNDLGRDVFREDRYRHCRDVNQGDCPHYKANRDDSLAWAVEELKAGREVVRLCNGTLSFHRLMVSGVVKTDYEIGGYPTEFDLDKWVKIMSKAQPHGWTSRPRTDDSWDSGILTRDVGWTTPTLNADDYLFRAGDGTSPPRTDDSRDSGDAAKPEPYSVVDWGERRPVCKVCGVNMHRDNGKLVPLEGKLCSIHLAAWELVDTPLHRVRDFESWCRRERLKGQVEACRNSREGAR
jgi:hypothetical protein